MCLTSKRNNEICWACGRLHWKVARCPFGCTDSHRPTQTQGCGVTDCLCVQVTNPYYRWALGWESWGTHLENALCHIWCLRHGEQQALSVHIPGCVFKSLKLLATVFPPSFCHCPHPPPFSYINTYWVSVKGQSLWCSRIIESQSHDAVLNNSLWMYPSSFCSAK